MQATENVADLVGEGEDVACLRPAGGRGGRVVLAPVRAVGPGPGQAGRVGTRGLVICLGKRCLSVTHTHSNENGYVSELLQGHDLFGKKSRSRLRS